MRLSQLAVAGLLCALTHTASAQTPPTNPHLAESGWPIFHQGSYAQASGQFAAPRDSDNLTVQFQPSAPGGTSPWTVLRQPYSDGSQAAIGSTLRGVVKHLIDRDRFEQISFLPLPRGRLHFDWNLLILKSGEIVATSRQENSLYLIGDTSNDCPDCELEIKRTFVIPETVGDMTVHFTVSYDGHLIVLLQNNRLAAIFLATGDVVAVHDLALSNTDFSFHNAFPIDETGRLYLASQQAVTAVDWQNGRFQTAWQTTYDFRGPDCPEQTRTPAQEVIQVARGEICTGSGTTPSLIGDPETGVVVTVDGHAPRNRLVAFWRGTIPADWAGLPNQERRVAAILSLPHSTPEGDGFTAENSPAVLGNSVFIAQWAGFNPGCSPPGGVQRVDWNPAGRRFDLIWANGKVQFNGVPTVSSRTGLVYGSGRTDCVYHYRGLDIATGELRLDQRMGRSARYLDQGNQQTIAADGSILFATQRGLVRIKQN